MEGVFTIERILSPELTIGIGEIYHRKQTSYIESLRSWWEGHSESRDIQLCVFRGEVYKIFGYSSTLTNPCVLSNVEFGTNTFGASALEDAVKSASLLLTAEDGTERILRASTHAPEYLLFGEEKIPLKPVVLKTLKKIFMASTYVDRFIEFLQTEIKLPKE